jgi:hypothetical protein
MPHVVLVNGDEHVAAEEQWVLVPMFSLRPAVHVHGGNDFVDGVRGRLPQWAMSGAISEREEQGLGALTIWFALALFISVPVLQDSVGGWSTVKPLSGKNRPRAPEPLLVHFCSCRAALVLRWEGVKQSFPDESRRGCIEENVRLTNCNPAHQHSTALGGAP